MSIQKKIKKNIAKAFQTAFHTTRYCITEGCKNKVISECHVIARQSQLKKIADSKGKVSWINPKPGETFFNKNRSVHRTDPISKVLTFYGFCSDCDNRLFKLIDEPFQASADVAKLLNYRSFCYTYWWTRVDINANRILANKMGYSQASMDPVWVPKSHAVKNQKEEGDYLELTHRAVEESLLNLIDEPLDSTFTHIFIGIKARLPYLFSCAVPLTVDIFNHPITLDWNTSIELPRMFWHLLLVDGKSVLIASWDKKYESLARHQLNLISALNDEERGRVLFQFCCINNMGFASEVDEFTRITNSGFDKIEAELRRAQETGSQANHLGIPSPSLEAPAVEIEYIKEIN